MKKNYFILGLLTFAILSMATSCKKNEEEDDDDNELTGRAAWVGSYDFNVTTVDVTWNSQTQSCSTATNTGTHLLIIDTVSSSKTVQSNQLVLKNMLPNFGVDLLVDVTGNSFVFSSVQSISGTGVKNGSTIEINYENHYNSVPPQCNTSTGDGTATKQQ